MSFEKWDDELTTLDMPPRRQREAAFKAGRAESEAEIAALKLERNALRDALSKLTVECFGSMGLEPELMRQLWGNTNVNILERRIAEARALLFAPASGEPARKP